MRKQYRSLAGQAGLPPGTLLHVGSKRSERTVVSLLRYNEQEVIEQDHVSLEALPAANQDDVTWLHVTGLSHIEVIERIGQLFAIHPLTLEDILNTNQRPKLEDYGDYVYITLKMMVYEQGQQGIAAENMNIVVGNGFVVSFQETSQPIFKPVQERIKSGKSRFRKYGADYLAYALVDMIIDHYFILLEQLGERVEGLEEELVTKPDAKLLPAIHNLKMELLYLRRSVWPLREVIAQLERGDSVLFKDHTLLYIRDIYDHTVQVIETVETYRDMTSSMLEIYLSSISNKMNEVIKMLTVISTIFMPLTFLAGLYGMNFKYMPELEWRYGYPAVLLLMTVIGVIMYRYFNGKKWI
ncbi:magnesium transporter [Anaerospora hongkongensis]|uniref:Magnesium transport protein CorA n=2 Tax=Anaerospora hongkongensis TaxID=244830 RepID=A0A4R1Q8X9_9FIRM|nr:magnesium transporter [Anaerospora hongkongensis]